ncbi:hypothetical protein [Enemella sp. A6]|uniref:hypothetical protein n=1 Tax=Enemella sp. A6 TaxID=3440152 RepID=UPI003EBB815D
MNAWRYWRITIHDGCVANSSTPAEADRTEPIHPGEILMEDFLEGFGILQRKLASA